MHIVKYEALHLAIYRPLKCAEIKIYSVMIYFLNFHVCDSYVTQLMPVF